MLDFYVIEKVLLKFQASPNDKELPKLRTIVLSLCSGSRRFLFLLQDPNNESTLNFLNTKICLLIDIA
jgi:hypothetical protein